MKKVSAITFISLLILTIGLIVLLCYIHFPKKTYYKDGTLQSVTQNNFLKQKKSTKIYINPNKPIDINYEKNKATVDLAPYFPAIKQNFDKFDLTIYTDNFFDLDTEKNNFTYYANGKLLCEKKDFIEKAKKLSENKSEENIENFFGCINLVSLSFGDKETRCHYRGEYIYPKFKKTSSFYCNKHVNNNIGFGINAEFNIQQQQLITTLPNIINNSLYTIGHIKGIEEFLKTLIEIYFLHDEKLFKAKFLANMFKNITISDLETVEGGKTIFSTSGDFNFTTGFSNPYKLSFYTNSEPTSSINVDTGSNAVNLYVENPITKKNVVTSNMVIGDKIISQYSNVSDSVVAEFLKNSDEIVQNLERLFASFANTRFNISDIIKNVNFNLSDKNGDKILEFNLSTKKDIDLKTFFENIYKYIDITMLIRDNNIKPIKEHLVVGNFVDGFTYEMLDIKKPVSVKEIIDIVKNSNLEQNIKEIYADLEQLYSSTEDDIISGNYPHFDPILFAIYQEIKDFLSSYTMTKNIDQITNLIINIKNNFSDKENYADLNNIYAKNNKLITENMYDTNDINSAKIKNASGGDVVIKASKLDKQDSLSNKSFVVEFSGLSQEECMILAANNWTIPDLVAIAAGKENINPSSEGYFGTIGFAVDEALKDNILSAKIQKDFILAMPENRFVPTPITYIQAYTACSGNKKDNAVALKFQ